MIKSVDRRCNSQKVRRKKIHPRQMLEKSRNAVFFHRFVCRVSPKVGLLKRRVRSQVASEVRDEKLHAVVAKSTFGSKNVQNTDQVSDHFWKFKKCTPCGAKNCTRLWRKAHFGAKSKCTKHTRVGPLLEVADVEKLHAAVAKSTFGSQNVTKHRRVRDHFWKFRCRKIARRCGEKHICKSKCTKHRRGWTTFGSSDVAKLHAAVAKCTFDSQNVKKL